MSPQKSCMNNKHGETLKIHIQTMMKDPSVVRLTLIVKYRSPHLKDSIDIQTASCKSFSFVCISAASAVPNRIAIYFPNTRLGECLKLLTH